MLWLALHPVIIVHGDEAAWAGPLRDVIAGRGGIAQWLRVWMAEPDGLCVASIEQMNLLGL